MSIKVALRHTTKYTYNKLISLGHQVVRLKPAPHSKADIESYSLKITPEDCFQHLQQDPFGNYNLRVTLPNKVKAFEVDVSLVVNMHVYNPFDFFLDDEAKEFPLIYGGDLKESLRPYLELCESGEELSSIVEKYKGMKANIVDFLVELNQELNNKLDYLIRLEPGVQSAKETLAKGSGSCRDMAWLLCLILRHLGLATRFTSGYLIQLKADVKSIDGPSGTDKDFIDLHAWTEVFIPGAGWVGLDPTSALLTGEGHIPLCCTPIPILAAPISGAIEECESSMEHVMTVERIREDPRITKPYTNHQWHEIDKLGKTIDKSLEEQDVRLTMGGEPTFVYEKNRDGAEWNFETNSLKKESLAQEFLERVGEKLGAGGVFISEQGKWCPGELLPRWSKNYYWRTDGEKILEDPTLFNCVENKLLQYNDVVMFAKKLSLFLGVDPGYLIEAYEDTPFYLWQQRKLPQEVEILKSDLYSEAERKKIGRLIEGNLTEPVGLVLPVAYSIENKRWVSCPWDFGTKNLILNIGDSAIGLRLPTHRLPFSNDSEKFNYTTPSFFEQKEKLLSYSEILEEVRRVNSTSEEVPEVENGAIKTAMCFELRDNQIYVFIPPTFYLEHFLQLIASLEQVVKQVGIPVRIGGYGPPTDLRVKKICMTPDPGVIEANIPPAKTWDSLKFNIKTIYDEARPCHLTTYKFLLDGKCVGTQGGNHIVVGGETPEDSPFLRRPDLLRSLVTFFQHHPSLSYLFSSTFIGPTSQAPRIDEARMDSLHELEIAFNQLDQAEKVPLWLVDRLFRNILVDITGNTHRSEFCIDKLFNPQQDNGRLGLLELRNFEMPPHYQMNLTQGLLVRALIATFWKNPYKRSLIRWGNVLHDKFLLPYYVWEDFKEVLTFLREKGGFHFKKEWFSSFYEFRFPLYGTLISNGYHIELRSALEPWHVLGEEIYQGGVSRSVDSSLERVELKVRGNPKENHVVLCGGVRVPLVQTDDPCTFVAGVRFKAWNPPSSLHPSIKPHAPLVFDLVDIDSMKAIAGFKYHVMHPGGRNYETAPINENEAEGRRLSRFEIGGHSSSINDLPDLAEQKEFKYTLDLRMV